MITDIMNLMWTAKIQILNEDLILALLIVTQNIIWYYQKLGRLQNLSDKVKALILTLKTTKVKSKLARRLPGFECRNVREFTNLYLITFFT